MEKAQEIDSNFAEAHYNLGLLYKKKGKKAEGLVELEEFLKLTGEQI